MSISNSYPTQRATLNLDFANSGKLDSRISFSRADTPPTYAAPSAVHYWSNEKHLSSENLVTQSDASNWIFSSADYTKTASQSGPDGSTNATKFAEKANGSEQYQLQSRDFTPIANQEITYSVWLKQTSGTRNYQQLRVGNIGANQAFATFNLTNGTVDQTGGTLGVSASVNAGPTGWYQCVLRFTPTSTTALSFYIYAASASGGEIPNVTGDTGNSFTLFGAQASTTGETVVNETSGSIHRSFAPTLKSVANAGDPRFEYAADGQSVGLLIEAQKSNLALNSNDITAATWNKIRVNVSANSAIGPDGALSASLISETTDTSTTHYFLPLSVIASGYSVGSDKVTHSVFAKYAGRNLRVVDSYNPMDGGSTVFDLQNGVVSTGGGVMQDCGNGWWRCSVTATLSNSGNVAPQFHLVDGTTWPNANDAGDGYSGILIYGLQTEQQSMSSYITTGSASVSRASDSCSVDLNGILADGQDVTLYAEGEFGDPAIKNSNRFAVALQENSNSYIILYNGGSNSGSGYVRDGGTDQAYFPSGVTAGAFKSAIAAKNNSFKYAVNGTSSTEDTAGTVPKYTTLRVGGHSSSGSELDGHVKRVAVYGQSLSSTELAALTS